MTADQLQLVRRRRFPVSARMCSLDSERLLMNTNTNDGFENEFKDGIGVDRIAIAKRLLKHAMTDSQFRYRTTVELNDRLCELIVKVGLYGWEVVFEWPDGFERLNEAIRHGLVWLTTAELLDLSRHIPLMAEFCAPGRPHTVHDIVAIGDDLFRHEDSGGTRTVTHAVFSAAFPDQGQPVWKLLAAPNPPPAMTQPRRPFSPRTPAQGLTPHMTDDVPMVSHGDRVVMPLPCL